MTKVFWKNIGRTITGSFGRYIAILLIIMLGVGFFCGLRLTQPVMSTTQADFVREQALYDVRVITTYGIDDDDIEAARNTEGVRAAEGSFSVDFLWYQGDVEVVTKAMLLTNEVNVPYLICGRMPEKGNEILVDLASFGENDLGRKIKIAEKNDEDTLDYFVYDEYEIVGVVNSVLYTSIERGTSSLGDGSIDNYMIFPREGLDFEYYTEVIVKSVNDFTPYSDEYDEDSEALSDRVEASIEASVNKRYNDIINDANEEIADAEKTLEEEKKDAEDELNDAKEKLDDAKDTLADAKEELDSAEKELSDAKVKLDDSKSELDKAKNELENAEKEIIAGELELIAANAELEGAKISLDAVAAKIKPDYTSWEDALSAGKSELEAGKTLLLEKEQEGIKTLNESKAAIDAAEADYAKKYSKYENGVAQLEAAFAAGMLPEEMYLAKKQELDTAKVGLDVYRSTLDANIAQYDQGVIVFNQKIEAAKNTLTESEAGINQFEAGINAYYSGLSEYNAAVAKFESGKASYEAGKKQYEDDLSAYETGKKQYEDGVKAYNDGKKKYEDGLVEYQDGLDEFNEKIADAEKEIQDAKDEVADLKEPELFVLSREYNAGYVSFESDSLIVDKVAAVFPVFFFLIAALVCSTTMTRMVDDDRTQIGVMRALGYSRAAIASKYIIYSGSAAIIGGVLGYIGGGYAFPKVIWIAYQMLYRIPGYHIVYQVPLFIIAMIVAIICSAGTTYLALRKEMNSEAAELVRPKTPQAGKRILLERMTFVWNRLKFLHKVSLRNIFRFKKRMIMMIIGIAGCTALVITGFGIRDSVADIADYQYDEIQIYDIAATYKEVIETSNIDELEAIHGADIDTYASAMMSSGELTGEKATKDIYFIVTNDETITDIVKLKNKDEVIAFPGDGEIVITDKIADMTGVKVGDTVELAISDTERAMFYVAGITENYVQNYVYMTGDTYEKSYGKDFEPKSLLLVVNENADEYIVGADLSNVDNVASVQVITDTRKRISNMMQSLNYVIILVIASAGALAFIVLFNLGNINISERVREIATIKVLGFHSNETGAYVFRENMILSIMGMIVGIPLGILLHAFVMEQIKIDMISFKVAITMPSFAFSLIIVFVFTILTDLIMRGKIAKIDMAESLKSVE